MHLPSLVQCLGMICFVGISLTGYVMDALVRRSLRFGNLLKPTIGLSLNVWTQSLLCSIIFQLLCMKPRMFGFMGLYLVTITGVLISCLVLTVSRSFCEYLAALSMCFFKLLSG